MAGVVLEDHSRHMADHLPLDAASNQVLKARVRGGAEDKSQAAEHLDHCVAQGAVNRCQTDHLGEILLRLLFSWKPEIHIFIKEHRRDLLYLELVAIKQY